MLPLIVLGTKKCIRRWVVWSVGVVCVGTGRCQSLGRALPYYRLAVSRLRYVGMENALCHVVAREKLVIICADRGRWDKV